jgi:NADPH:quinone reductase-like Zn-dependent oxidoreductase
LTRLRVSLRFVEKDGLGNVDEVLAVAGSADTNPLEGTMSFDGCGVVVMGGSSGIGEATARAFAGCGARVVITGRSKERLDAAAQRIGHPVRTPCSPPPWSR